MTSPQREEASSRSGLLRMNSSGVGRLYFFADEFLLRRVVRMRMSEPLSAHAIPVQRDRSLGIADI